MTRRVVLDTSVLIAASFSEPHSRRADRLVSAVEADLVKGFAWPGLSNEFLKVLASKSFGREGRAYVPADLIESAATRYFDLRLISITDEGWTEEVWHLIRDERVSPPDAWPLATAIQLDAELWLTHDHADSFVSAARRLHPAVYTLAADGDRLP